MAGLLSALRDRLARLFGGAGRSAFGRQGEEAAARLLEKSGYTVVARNYRTRGGEADLVATKAGCVHAVEVKSRSGRTFGAPAQAVTPKKARRVLRAGRAYCRAKGISLTHLRGDVVAVERDAHGHLTLRHYPNVLSDRAPGNRRP